MKEELSLDYVVDAFTQWRSCRKGGEAIPNDLLRLAACAAAEFGSSVVAKAVGLNSTRLSREVALLREGRAVISNQMSFSRVEAQEVWEQPMQAQATAPKAASSRPLALMNLASGVSLELWTLEALEITVRAITLQRGGAR